jgi:putative endonuclease
MPRQARHDHAARLGSHTMRDGFVYIMASITRTLYIGITNSLERRVWQHQHSDLPGFTKRYDLKRLVYFEYYEDIRDAISREKQLKGWRRSKKNALIESLNPKWEDLTASLFEPQPRVSTRHPGRSEAETKDRERGTENPDTRSPFDSASRRSGRALDRLGMTTTSLLAATTS